ncbi:multidrug ABC transporter permease/ATP-binding protein [Methylocucumis oryzae]|uniref:Multidrug transporter membrane component/ATP-binding component n=1 Tax=Methylocucumis oryzae TaxID=1632867 RepID=A0A0F3IG29_9GAMM|nr:multidrug ABC transporter permease/ATP-binding protein [Methylocucumis oryzae]KJV05755.1 multidrug transporter membrane component/ATP-binding component [Methylocucumis oryzae]
MNLVRLLFKQFKLSLLLVFTLSLISASLAVSVIAFTNEQMLHPHAEALTTLLQFVSLLVAVFIIGVASQIGMTTLGHRLVYQLRRTLLKRLLDTDLEQLEKLGPARILASLSSDIQQLTSAFISLPNAVYGLVLTLGGFAYLAWLSQTLFMASVAWLFITVLVAWLLMTKTYAHVDKARDIEDLLYADYQAVLSGRKELALNRQRARRFYAEEFIPHAQQGCQQDIYADRYNGINENWVNTMMLGAIGWVYFLTHYQNWGDHHIATTFSLTILFLRTPLTSLVSAVPSLLSGSVALNKLNSLALPDYCPEFSQATTPLYCNWHTLTLQDVSYRYDNPEQGSAFLVGPLQFHLQQGETVFIIGGNGSGKSTFLRLLTGLYTPQSGQILLEDQQHNLPATEYRQLFATVFSDFHLFHQLLDAHGRPAKQQAIRFWLERLQLTDKVDYAEGRLLDTQLSQGQRKRLALLLAILEDRPILVLDEWAADQDPGYRRIFYHELLPLLKAQGKTIVAVSHDENYFHCADRVLKMAEGVFVSALMR